MTITPDGLLAAAEREKEAHPTLPNGKPITAWDRRAQTLNKTVQRVNDHDVRLLEWDAIFADGLLDRIESKLDDLLSRPF